MNRVGIVLYILACVASGVMGWLFAGADKFGRNRYLSRYEEYREVRFIPPNKGGDGSREAFAFPMTYEEICKKELARISGESLWRLLISERDSRRQLALDIGLELVNRKGWLAWNEALALKNKEQRGFATHVILVILGNRDPLRAFEIWQQYRHEFESTWGWEAAQEALMLAGKSSAAAVIDVMNSSQANEEIGNIPLEYSQDFDFASLANYLTDATISTVGPNNVLTEWAKRSPLGASQWLADHPWLLENQEWKDNSWRVIREVAILSKETSGRSEALKILGGLPEDIRQTACKAFGDEQGGVFSSSILEAAAEMNHEDDYLSHALIHTLQASSLDPSW